MSKPSKKAKSGKLQQRQRRERRFEPRASTNPWIVYGCGVLGATAMGAGSWGQFGPALSDSGADPFKYAPFILAGGALLVGIAIWFGTSGDPALRVGDGGVGVEKGTTRRIPWHQVESVTFTGAAVKVMGKDDTEQPLTITASLTSHPQAAAWIVAEARKRIGSLVDVPEGAPIPEKIPSVEMKMEALRVVGRHCAHSGKVISYEPDARVCPRCERIYHRELLPQECLCGAQLRAPEAGTDAEAPSERGEGEGDAVATEAAKMEPAAADEKQPA